MSAPSHFCHECPKFVPCIGWCPILAWRRLRNQPMCTWALENRMWEGGEPYAPFIREERRDDGDEPVTDDLVRWARRFLEAKGVKR